MTLLAQFCIFTKSIWTKMYYYSHVDIFAMVSNLLNFYQSPLLLHLHLISPPSVKARNTILFDCISLGKDRNSKFFSLTFFSLSLLRCKHAIFPVGQSRAVCRRACTHSYITERGFERTKSRFLVVQGRVYKGVKQ